MFFMCMAINDDLSSHKLYPSVACTTARQCASVIVFLVFSVVLVFSRRLGLLTVPWVPKLLIAQRHHHHHHHHQPINRNAMVEVHTWHPMTM